MILGFILDHILGPKKDKIFCPKFVFHRGMSNAICDLVLYLQNEGLNISWISSGTIRFQYLKTVFAIQYSTFSIKTENGQNSTKVISTTNSSLQTGIFAVLMFALYGNPRNFKFKEIYQQYGPCFQAISLFLMTMFFYFI